DQRVHLHEPIERRARRLQQQLEVLENDMRLTGQRAVHALAGLRVDRQHAGAEDQPAGADRRRLVMAVVMPEIEPRPGRRDDVAGHVALSSPKIITRHLRSYRVVATSSTSAATRSPNALVPSGPPRSAVRHCGLAMARSSASSMVLAARASRSS